MGFFTPLAVCLAFSYLVVTTIYNLFFHPLAKYPGPFLCRISGLPSFYHACIGDRHIWSWQQFQIYGSKFRAAPNLLLFDTPEAFNSIFNPKANVKKSRFYEAWERNENDQNTLSCTDVALHAQKRRLLALAFTDQSVKASGPFMAKHIDRWNELLPGEKTSEDGWGEVRNMSTWVDYLVFDVLGDLCFGRSFETKEPGDNPLKEIPHSIADYVISWYPVTKSPLLDLILWLRPRGLWKLMIAATPENIKNYWNFAEEAVAQRLKEERQREADKKPIERQDMFHFLCTARNPDTNELAFNDVELCAEANLLIVAGSDTTSTIMAGLFFNLTHQPRVYAKLVREIRDTFTSPEEIVHGPKLASCTYLRACIDETLRIAPAGASELEREVLPGGALIDDEFIPAGVVLGVPQWSLWRNPDVYGDGTTFRPERWIVSDHPDTINTEDDVMRLKRATHPFGKGVGNCLGQKLAVLQLSMAVARTLWRMDLRLAPGEEVGGGRDELGWGRRDRNAFMLRDAYISLKDGPLVQFRKRVQSS